MAFTSQFQSRQWLQIAFLLALGALAAASAAWGQIVESVAFDDSPKTSIQDSSGPQSPQRVWPQKLISEINIDPRDVVQNKPADASIVLIDSASPLHWFNSAYTYQVEYWTAPNIYYQPLWFEDVALERYGQQHWGHLDLARTGILFFGGVLTLPYNAFKVPKHTYDSPLGYARPGSPAPSTHTYLLRR